MSKGLRNMSKDEREQAIRRRLSNTVRGLGYWGAVDASARIVKQTVANVEVVEEPTVDRFGEKWWRLQ